MKSLMWLLGLCTVALLAAGVGCGDDDGGCDECPALYASRCTGTVVQACIADNNACLKWMTSTDCATMGGICDDSEGGALCSEGCTVDCDLDGGRFCSGNVTQSCEIGVEGCLFAMDRMDCEDNGQICVDSGGAAQCVDGP